MRFLRAGAAAALATTLLLTGAAPAAAGAADTTEPVVSSTGLVEGQLLGQFQRITPVYSDDVEVVRIDLLIDGQLQRSQPLYPGVKSVPLWPDVKFNGHGVDLTVQAFDAAGNSGEAVTRVRVDTEPPVATFTPGNGTKLRKGLVTIKATGVSPDTVEITSSDARRVSSAPWVFSWDAAPFANETAHVSFQLTDRAGNRAGYGREYYVDAAGPAIHVRLFPTLVGPGESNYNAWTSDMTLPDRIEWWVDGVRRSTGQGYTHDFGRKSRVATVTFRAWDGLGNASSLTRKVTVDATGPAVTWISPRSGALLRGRSVPTSIRAVDAHPGTTALLGNNASGYHACKPVCSAKALLFEGRQDIIWYVYDRFGNPTVVRRTVTVDNTGPRLKVTKAPKNKAKVKGTVKVTASADDKYGVARVELLINGKVVAKDTKAAYKFSVNTKKYGKKLKVQVRAYDKAGNVTTSAVRTWHR